jgi:hypothetical protein
MREEIRDRRGNIIYLTDERWDHILENHSELDSRRDKVVSTVRAGKRKQDPLLPDKFYYNKKFPHFLDDYDEIEVVVIFRWHQGKPNSFIITAYPV